MDHGVASHTRADQGVKILGDVLHAVRKAEGHGGLHAVFRGIAPGGVQGAGSHIGLDHVRGDAVRQQMDAQVAMVTANIRHPVALADEITAGQKPFRDR